VIVVDTSALVTVFQGESLGERILDFLNSSDSLAMSAGTLTEALIIASHRKFLAEMQALIERLDIEIVPVTAQTAALCAEAHLKWSAGRYGLNYGDTFAYALAKSRNCPLLFVGNDFSHTDIVSAI
jgi:ribonuclease VapC